MGARDYWLRRPQLAQSGVMAENTTPRKFGYDILAGALLAALFCAFFWLGYVAGQTSAVQAAAPSAEPVPTPSSERLALRTVLN